MKRCLSTGRPEPVVTWLIDNLPAPQYIGVKTDTHVMVNRLELQHLKREDLNTTFKCRAANTHLMPPQDKSVRLEMNCKSHYLQHILYSSQLEQCLYIFCQL